MIEFPDVGDLRPAPSNTPTAVLWLMLLVVVGGAAALLAWPEQSAATKSALNQIDTQAAASGPGR